MGEWVKRKIKYKYELTDPLRLPWEPIGAPIHPLTGEESGPAYEWWWQE